VLAEVARVCRGPLATRDRRVPEPVAAIARSLDVAAGLAPPDGAWAWGQAWRSLYPAIVDRLGADGLAEADWPRFLALAGEMERLAFGPPAANAAKLMALVDAGVVDARHVRGGRLVSAGRRTALRSGGGATPVDVVVDAVLPGPGAGAESGLPARLLADGLARTAPGRRGLDVCDDGTCRLPDGSRAEGLAALGRPAEDSVIGNDTLSRGLHPHAGRWASRVVRRACEQRSEQPRERQAVLA
jgi:diaminopimelate decarboxylase